MTRTEYAEHRTERRARLYDWAGKVQDALVVYIRALDLTPTRHHPLVIEYLQHVLTEEFLNITEAMLNEDTATVRLAATRGARYLAHIYG